MKTRKNGEQQRHGSSKVSSRLKRPNISNHREAKSYFLIWRLRYYLWILGAAISWRYYMSRTGSTFGGIFCTFWASRKSPRPHPRPLARIGPSLILSKISLNIFKPLWKVEQTAANPSVGGWNAFSKRCGRQSALPLVATDKKTTLIDNPLLPLSRAPQYGALFRSLSLSGFYLDLIYTCLCCDGIRFVTYFMF